MGEQEMNNEQQHYVNEFKAFQQNGAAKSPAWVNDVRTSALSEFSAKGFPTTKDEEWKYTNVAPIASTKFEYSSAAAELSPDIVQSHLVAGIDQHLLVFVNGHVSAAFSRIEGLPDGAAVKSIIEAYATHGEIVQSHLSKYADGRKNPFTALNTAFINDGAFIHLPAGTRIEKPVHIIFISSKKENKTTASHIRNLIVAEARSEVNILISCYSAGENNNLTNIVTEVVAGENSAVEIVKVQRESESSFHVENMHVHQHARSTVHLFSLAVGGAIARNDMSVEIGGESTECNLNGLYIASGEQLIDHHTMMHHIHPNCPSHELFKGILMDNARAVFNGKVYVEPEAQKTDSKQTNRNLLLSDTAVVDTKPELEIFADDVKCTHGATVGGMNETHSLYLKTRGITEESARGILTVGFAAEATEKIKHPGLRRHVDLIVVDHLRKKFGTGNLPDIVHA